MSFKYGSVTREVDGRVFTDLNEKSLEQLVNDLPETYILDMWITEDVSPERRVKWINAILR